MVYSCGTWPSQSLVLSRGEKLCGQNGLPSSSLQKAPISAENTNGAPERCAICSIDFQEIALGAH